MAKGAIPQKPHVARGADVHRSKKGSNRNKTHPKRGKGHLAGALEGAKTTPFTFGKQNAMRRPKSSEPDNVGRKIRPAAHNARQAGVAKRAARTVKKLSNQVI